MLLKNMMQAKHKVIISVKPSTPINEALDMLTNNNIGCLPVLDENGKITGIISERDILLKINEAVGDFPGLTVADIMTTKVIMGSPDDDLSKITEIMEDNKIRHLPIVREEKLIGLISLWEIYKTRLQNMEAENRHLANMLFQRDKTGEYDFH